MELNNKTIIRTTIILASRADVWKKWTTREGLLSFFPRDCWVDLKIGGAFEMYFMTEGERGTQGSEGCKILSYLPERMLSFSWNAPPTIPSVRNHLHKAWVVINFEDVEGGTKVELTHLGFLKGEDWEETIRYFENAWTLVLEGLEQSFSNEEINI